MDELLRPDRFMPLAVLGVLFIGILVAMWFGWKNRTDSDSDLPEPLPVSNLDLPSEDEMTEAVEEHPAPSASDRWEADGIYVSTTKARQPLERVTVHNMGARSEVTVRLGSDRIQLVRSGATSFEIPMQSVLQITTARGMAGKVVGRNGLSVIRWRLGERELDTGIRFHTRDDHNEFLTRSTTIHQENS